MKWLYLLVSLFFASPPASGTFLVHNEGSFEIKNEIKYFEFISKLK